MNVHESGNEHFHVETPATPRMRTKQGAEYLLFHRKEKKERSFFFQNWFITNNNTPYIGIMSSNFANSCDSEYYDIYLMIFLTVI